MAKKIIKNDTQKPKIILPTKIDNLFYRFLYLGTSIIFIFLCISFYNNNFLEGQPKWMQNDPKFVYSFERNYNKINGFKDKCKLVAGYDLISISENCKSITYFNNIEGSFKNFLNLYKEYKGINYYVIEHNLCKNKSAYGIEKLLCDSYKESLDFNSLNNSILEGEFNNIEYKEVINIKILIYELGKLVMIPIITYFFLKYLWKYLITNEKLNKNMNKKNILLIISSLLLFIALLDGLPYGYFQFLRFFTMFVGAYLAYQAYKDKQEGWTWLFGAVAILFNPFIPLALGRDIWWFLDLITGIILVYSVFKFKLQK